MFFSRKPKTIRFEDFYRSHAPGVFRLYRSLGVSDVSAAEDLVQETFLEAHRCWQELREEGARKAWLYTIARRRWSRYIQRLIKQRVEVAQSYVEEVASEELGPGDSRSVPSDTSVEMLQLCRRVASEIEAIDDPVRRKAMTAFFIESRSLKEVAGEAGVLVSTVTTWCSRLRARLRELDTDSEKPRSETPVSTRGLGEASLRLVKGGRS